MKKIISVCLSIVTIFCLLSVSAAAASKINISRADIPKVASQIYGGKAITPSFTVKYGKKVLKKGRDYTAAYKNNTKVGLACISVKGKGAYKGSKNIYFKILPPRLTGLKLVSRTTTSVTLCWNKTPGGVSGYKIADAKSGNVIRTTSSSSYTVCGLTSGKTYTFKVYAYKRINKSVSCVSAGEEISVKPLKNITYSDITYNPDTAIDTYPDIYFSDKKLLAGVDYNIVYNYANPRSRDSAYIDIKFCGDYRGFAGNINYNSFKIKSLSEVKKSGTPLSMYSLLYAQPVPDGSLHNRYVPQGVEVFSDYILISAYDKSGKYNSIINIYNRASKKYLSTLYLPASPHCGGICYDGEYLWVAGTSSLYSLPARYVEQAVSTGAVTAVARGDFKKFVFNEDTSDTIHNVSYCTYYDGSVWIGSYSHDKDAGCGLAKRIAVRDGEVTSLTPISSFPVTIKTQGLSFVERDGKTYAILSGREFKNGKELSTLSLRVYEYKNSTIDLGKCLSSVDTPDYVETTAIDNSTGSCYLLFESGATDYKKWVKEPVTDLLELDLDKILP